MSEDLQPAENVSRFDTGAMRSKDADDVRFDLVSPIGLRRVAEAYAEGFKKYPPHNWMKGIPFSSLINHAIRHIFLYIAGDRSEDHLGHAAWNLFTAMHFEETRSELNDLPKYVTETQNP